MKSLKHILIVAALALIAVGCEKKVEVSLASNEIVVAHEGGTTEVLLTSNGDWSVATDMDWVTVTPMSGNGDETLTLTVAANQGTVSRTGQVKVSSKDNMATLTVRQEANEAAPFITIDPAVINCFGDGGNFDVSLTSNCTWEVGLLPEWISFSVANGEGNAQVTVTVKEMIEVTPTSREADITIGNADVSAVLHIVQRYENIDYLNVYPQDIETSYESAVATVTVLCSEQWNTELEEDWIVIEPASGTGDATVSLSIAANENFTPRVGRVHFISQSGIKICVTVSQAEAPDPHYLNVNPLMLEFEGQGGSADIAVECDIEWEARSEMDWIQLSSASAVGNGTIHVQVAPSDVPYERRGEVIVISGERKAVVHVIQDGSGELPVISMQPDTIFIDEEGGAGSINITANVPWTLVTDGWVNLFQNSGTGDATVSFYVDKNPNPRDRIAHVRAMYNNQMMAEMVVFQYARIPFIELSQTEIIAPREGGHYEIGITSNQAWMVNKGDTWTPFSPTNGYGNGKLVIDIDSYTGTGIRTTEIHVNGMEDNSTVVIMIKQQGD